MRHKLPHKPISNRFNHYGDADKRADAVWHEYQKLESFESHGGAHLHEQPPHVQRLVYDFARALYLNSKGITVEQKSLPCASYGLPKEFT